MKTEDPFKMMSAQEDPITKRNLQTNNTEKSMPSNTALILSPLPAEVTVGGEELPVGGWRGGEEIPAGGWRGGEEIPAGGWRGGEEIPAGGWRSATLTRDTYRTKDGRFFFDFVFVPVDDHYEIDILRQPSYGSRDTSQHATHRLSSSRGGNKICFGDNSVVSTLSEAKHWASIWAECTMEYILHGDAIPNE